MRIPAIVLDFYRSAITISITGGLFSVVIFHLENLPWRLFPMRKLNTFQKFEWRTKMSVWNKVLLVLIFLCAAAFVYFGADALKMRRESQKKLVDAQKALEAEKEKKQKLYFGTGQDDGYISLVNEVDRLRAFRGTRAWPNCMPIAQALVNGTTVTVQLQVDALPAPSVSQPVDPLADDPQADDLARISSPDPGAMDPGTMDPGAVSVSVTPPQNRVLPGTIVYLFEKRTLADGGCLLGEFTVARVDDNRIATLTNVYQMTEAEIARINDSVAELAPWAVYTVLPRTAAEIKMAGSQAGGLGTDEEAAADAFEPDDDDALAGDNPAGFVVAETTPEILTDPTTDPRPALAQTFASLNNKRRQLLNHIDMLKIQQEALATTQVEATTMIGFYQKEKEDTQAKQQETLRQNTQVAKLYDATVAEIMNIEERIANFRMLNKKMLAELTRAQLRASEIIHEREVSLSMTH